VAASTNGGPRRHLQEGQGSRFNGAIPKVFVASEQAGARLRSCARSVSPCTFDRVCGLMAAALRLFMPDECANYVRHCDYRFITSKSKMHLGGFESRLPDHLEARASGSGLEAASRRTRVEGARLEIGSRYMH
jgi:hypothetical protein